MTVFSKLLPSIPTPINPITFAFRSEQFHTLQKLSISTYQLIFKKCLPSHSAGRLLIRLSKSAYAIVSWLIKNILDKTGIILMVRLLWKHFKLLLILLTSQILWSTIISRHYYIFTRWLYDVLNPAEKEKRVKLHDVIDVTTDYSKWATATSQLDELDGLYAWKYENTSPHYDYFRLERFCSILLHLYLTQNSPAIIVLLSSHLARNFCNILNPELYNVLGVGTKQLIEDYIQLVINSLDLVSRDQSIPIQERLSFISKLRHVFGRTGLFLSGGATLALYHSGVMVELIRTGLCPAVISGASGGSLLGALIACRTDHEVLDIMLKHPENIFMNMYYQAPLSQRQLEIFGSQPVIHPRPRKTLFDIRVLQHAIKQLIPANMTFLDAYHHSGGRIFNVVIHNESLASGYQVCNYLMTPHVYVASAVAASCALPGVFESCAIHYSATYSQLVLGYLRGKLANHLQQRDILGNSSNNNNHNNNNNNNNNNSSGNGNGNPLTLKSVDASLVQDSLIGLSRSKNQSHLTPQQSSPQPTHYVIPRTSSTASTASLTLSQQALQLNSNLNSSDQPALPAPKVPFVTSYHNQSSEAHTATQLSEEDQETITTLFGDNRLYADGSLGADLPFQVLKEQFGCNFSIVSQANPHIAPILKCFPTYFTSHENRPYSISIVNKTMELLLHTIQYIFLSFRSTILNLTDTKLFPWFPATLRSMLSQTYSGDITILPPELTLEVYSKAISNPSVEFLNQSRDQSMRNLWRYITRIKTASKIEHHLQKISFQLRMALQESQYLSGVQSQSDSNPSTTAPPRLRSGIGITAMGSSVGLCTLELSSQPPRIPQHVPNQPYLPSDLARQSSFHQQYMQKLQNADSASQTSGVGTAHPEQRLHVGNGMFLRYVYDADDDYYDVDGYLYENTNDQHQDATDPVQIDPLAIISNTPLAELHPTEINQPVNNQHHPSSASNYNDFSASEHSHPHTTSSGLYKGSHRNSFYRIKSSFGALDTLADDNHPRTNILLPVNATPKRDLPQSMHSSPVQQFHQPVYPPSPHHQPGQLDLGDVPASPPQISRTQSSHNDYTPTTSSNLNNLKSPTNGNTTTNPTTLPLQLPNPAALHAIHANITDDECQTPEIKPFTSQHQHQQMLFQQQAQFPPPSDDAPIVYYDDCYPSQGDLGFDSL